MTKQVSEHPELLSLGQDIADTAQLIAQAEKAEDNARAAAAKLSALRRQLRRAAAADPSLQKADAIADDQKKQCQFNREEGEHTECFLHSSQG